MSHPRRNSHRKSSKTSTTSSENHLWQHIQQPSTSSSSLFSIQTPTYPNVPKRIQRMSSIHEDEIIQTESQISITPSNEQSQKHNGYSSTTSTYNPNAQTLHNLNLIAKYTSPQKEPDHCSSTLISNQFDTRSNNNEPNYGSTYKRALSPLNETNHQIQDSKRTRSINDEDDDDDDVYQFIDHRRNKQTLSQSTLDDKQIKTTTRKPTVRKLSNSQRKPTTSQTQPTVSTSCKSPEALIIELDVDPEEDNTTNREETNWLHKCSGISKQENHSYTKLRDLLNKTSPTIDNSINSINANIPQTPVKDHFSSHLSLNSTFKRTQDNPSLYSNVGERRMSSTSSNSLVFDTPRSSLSRTTTGNMTSTPQTIMKHDRETQITSPAKLDILNQLILQMNLNSNDNQLKIDYNPTELAKKFFHQYNSFSLDIKYQSMNLLMQKQVLNFGRYEIEVLFSMNNKNLSRIYACDICLKHFHGSLIAFQRHNAKCLANQPPGTLVFNENNLAIFQIGQTKMNIEQRIYIKSLCRITRLFIDSNKSIDDRKIDRFTYYILCRKDPILSQSQSSFYRFIGYFSKQLNHNASQSLNNLSCLSILPPFAQNQEYSQLLIAFSYHLIRTNTSTNLMYSSPARPLDSNTLSSFRIYWRDVLFAYILHQNTSSITTISLDIVARQTSIHPRDILLSLYSYNFILSHPIDKSSVYLRNTAYHLMTSLNVHTRNKVLFMDTKMFLTDNEKKMINDKSNIVKNHDSGIEEIVLD